MLVAVPPGAFWVSGKYSHDEANGHWESTNIKKAGKDFPLDAWEGVLTEDTLTSDFQPTEQWHQSSHCLQ